MVEPGKELEPIRAVYSGEKKEDPIEAMFKRLLGFVPGEDDELREELERKVQEIIAREGSVSERIKRAPKMGRNCSGPLGRLIGSPAR